MGNKKKKTLSQKLTRFGIVGAATAGGFHTISQIQASKLVKQGVVPFPTKSSRATSNIPQPRRLKALNKTVNLARNLKLGKIGSAIGGLSFGAAVASVVFEKKSKAKRGAKSVGGNIVASSIGASGTGAAAAGSRLVFRRIRGKIVPIITKIK